MPKDNDDIIRIVSKLNKAAWLVLNGAVVVDFVGDHWSNAKVVIELKMGLLQESDLVPWHQYMKTRAKLKRKIYKVFGRIS